MKDRTLVRPLALVILLGLLAAGTSGARTDAPARARTPDRAESESPPPRLVLYVVVDQMPFDYVERFRPVLTGGLARLLDEGVVFTRAFHRHAVSTTAPGHATLATGRHPRAHGIIGNWWWDRERGEYAYCVEGAEDRTGPFHLEASTLGDWLRVHDSEARVFAASPKDRGAVLLAGHEADGAYWYDDETGTFESSSYYPEAEPDWLAALTEERWLDRYFGKSWEPLPLPESLTAEDRAGLGVLDLDTGVFDRAFPHALGRARTAPSESFYDAIYSSPFVDEYLVELVTRLLEAEDLGTDEHTDLLGVSFSSLDTVGHDYGPDSPEILDAVRRLDRNIGRLLERVEERVGRDRLVVALAADHGVMPLPEHERLQGRDAHREDARDVACIQGVYGELGTEAGEPGRSESWLEAPGYLSREAVFRSGRPRTEVEDRAREVLEACPTVERVWTRGELAPEAPGESAEDSMAALYRNAFHPERSPDLMIQRKPHRLTRPGTGTTHTSPYPYDTHVPMIVRAPGLAPARIERPVATVDLAPTLAILLGVPTPDDLDGEPLLTPPGPR